MKQQTKKTPAPRRAEDADRRATARPILALPHVPDRRGRRGAPRPRRRAASASAFGRRARRRARRTTTPSPSPGSTSSAGEFQSAQDLLNGLLLANANDPEARALLDQLITAKKAAEEAARQEGLAAQRNQQNQLQASLDELGQNIRTSGSTERIVIQQPAEAAR